MHAIKPAEFYASVCGCPNTEAQCPGIRNSPSTGWPPRAFFTKATAAPIAILVVGKNPGHPLLNETDLYRGKTPYEIAAANVSYAESVFRGEVDHLEGVRASTTFHKNLVRYLSFFLDVPDDPGQVFRYAAFTNLVKCSSPGERDRLQLRTMEECFSKHFLREVDYFRPRLLLALGREVEGFLERAARRHRFPVVYVKHPSYYYRKDKEAEILSQLKVRTRECLDA